MEGGGGICKYVSVWGGGGGGIQTFHRLKEQKKQSFKTCQGRQQTRSMVVFSLTVRRLSILMIPVDLIIVTNIIKRKENKSPPNCLCIGGGTVPGEMALFK